MAHILSDFDDLTVVSSRAPDPDAFTLCTIGRNEMYFLPAFLEHYRKLGIEQFAVLNDRSDDGTRDYLLAQGDVVLLESNFAYGDTVNLPSGISEQVSNGRILYVWRALLFDRFAKSGWAVQLDMDEFVHLPPNTQFQDVARALEKESASAALGLMVDVYPSDIGALARQASDTEIDLNADWFFDGEPHLKLRENRAARVLHAGARARLYHTYGTDRLYEELGLPAVEYKNWFSKMRRTQFGTKVPFYNMMQKPILAKWDEEALFTNSHEINRPVSASLLIPFQHFRFSGALYAKIEMALRENSYSSGSRDHRLLTDLLSRMQEGEGSFMYRRSKPVTGYDGFKATGVAFGL